MAELIYRESYMEQLRKWKGSEVIKVITGIRRCGKSTLLKQYMDELTAEKSGNIIYVNFEELKWEPLTEYHALFDYLEEQLKRDQINYIFLDEIQMVDRFQKVVNSLQLKDNVDIYITGSNAYLLSGELSTLLSGRYIEIEMLPLSFQEYCIGRESELPDALFTEYLQNGAFPYVKHLQENSQVAQYLEGIYNTIIIKDIEEREARRQRQGDTPRITDLTLLRNISRYLAGNIGNYTSMRSIAGYITSTGRKVSQNTIADYVTALVEPFLYYPVERFDILGKQLLTTNGKYYIVDLGFRRHLLNRSHYDLGFSLENVVFLELRRRGYQVNVGKLGQLEVDFIAKKGDTYTYYQVTANMTDESTFERELEPLRKVQDNYQKVVLTLDRFTAGNYDGIVVQNVVDWLLES